MKTKLFLLPLITMFLMTSCATIFTGTKDTIRFDSKPQGAKVYIDGIEICKTPCTSEVKRSLSDKLAEVKLDGYQTRVIKLDREFNVISVINLTNLVGWGVDALTGSLMKYDKKSYDVKLERQKNVSLNNPRKINIDTEQEVVKVYVVEK